MDHLKPIDPLFRIVIVEPEIPQNTGNIGRTCVGSTCELHLIKPMSFEITDTQVKRAGLDYWPYLSWKIHESFNDWYNSVEDKSRIFYIENKVEQTIFDAKFQKGDWLVFGKETKGLDPDLLMANLDRAYMIPQTGPVRSLNLATAVAITIYEGFRQVNL
ncbi:MAG: tRNA (cytidine(34)-2'-O)-methyltransferase [Pseudobdellovibrio sp.]|nr:tRNA (cytidine(34)-2'-O)-methyltransferase [Pseudobdellovibrio sp.]